MHITAIKSAAEVVARTGERRERGVIVSEHRAAIPQDNRSSETAPEQLSETDTKQLHNNKNVRITTVH